MFYISAVSAFSVWATTYRDDHKLKETLRYKEMAGLVLHDDFP